jgi:mannose-6-phosphate isomerase-like protein (cupin superfamily)
MAGSEEKRFAAADEVRTFEKGKAELVKIGGGVVGELTLQPGWRWSTPVKPIAKTEWCEAPHFPYHVSGRLHVKMKDGKEFEVGPGEVTLLPSGHDARGVGNGPAVVVDWAGALNYAKTWARRGRSGGVVEPYGGRERERRTPLPAEGRGSPTK